MRIRDYNVTDADKITAELLNQVTDDFSNALTETFLELRSLKGRSTMFKNTVGSSLDYLISTINGLTTAQTGLKISAYNPPDESNNVQLDHSFGQITLAESNRTTHIPLVEDNFSRQKAIASVLVETGATESTFQTNIPLRNVVDGDGELWMAEINPIDTDSGSIWIKITTPTIGLIPNFVSIYPLAGTEVEIIKVFQGANSTQFSPASKWPVKLNQNFSDYSNEVRFKIKGVLNLNGNYVFAIRKIDIFSVTYASQGYVKYITQDAFSTITSITKNSPFFYPSTAEVGSMMRIQIFSLDELTTIHDSFVSSTIDPVPSGPDQVKVKITLFRTDGNTPFFRTLV